jgi:hypothetical protein
MQTTHDQHPIRLRLFPAQHKALTRLARREGCSLQELIRLAVARYLLTGERKSAAMIPPPTEKALVSPGADGTAPGSFPALGR